VEDVAELNTLTLQMKYNDGFVAYLNGVEVARVGFDGTPQWDSSANANHEADAQGFDLTLDLSSRINLLRQGNNLLAIQGLNVSRTSSDFIVSAALEGVVRD